MIYHKLYMLSNPNLPSVVTVSVDSIVDAVEATVKDTH